MAENRKNWGVIAQFENPAKLLEAAQAFKARGYRDFETWSPFPVHGMDDAMGLSGSKVPWITLCGGLTGLTIGLLLQWWSGSQEYPLIIGGKPFFTWQFAVPVTFELSILLFAFGTVFGMFALNKLPTPYHPLDNHAPFRRVTDDAFFLSVEVTDPIFDMEKVKALLAELGGKDITVVED